ncbi:pentatricopeptide repeat-containing protein At1g77360, mitochondrial-like [Amaranthus tricolor]|uniref:pentatricopeptide repeat-containing protein At1g77360, mitochondrial-like n=1 Tax=Amaranthus tricolor TaxID=29722 RepID=UPI00258DD104|nr:pentatricopeptide repeat-containing protein At1g77360, mitochondrial-like [Amaranthus tricolor]XP_057525232.1 pentatricopeptide repeat-containing protein At1g77360, mitochondrial-like [Amaranthus tricolor]
MGDSRNMNYPSRLAQSMLKSQHPEKLLHENQGIKFPTYHDLPYVTPRTRILCDIVYNTQNSDIEAALNSSGITPSCELVEEVLKLSYGSPNGAVSFFRWAGLTYKPSVSVYSWNLMVDLLGKNKMFDQLWAAIRSMKEEGLLSLATFVSVFGSYCTAGKFEDAIMTFETMHKYGIEPDVVAVNSLLSAMCREKDQTKRAYNFFDRMKLKIPPDGDTFAILLEGWEKERNVSKAKTTFGEMVVRVGWDVKNMAAYTAFLMTLVRGSQVDEAVKFFQLMKGKGCLPGLKFFTNALDILVKKNDSTQAVPLWDSMVGSGIMPNLITFNAMIGLLCNNNDIENAFRFLDDMPFYGVFPDSQTYNMIFECLINNKKVREVASFFREMTKNEFPPTLANCAAAIEMLFERDDPETGIEIWNSVLVNRVMPIDDCANILLLGLCTLGRFSELKRFAYDMLDQRIIIYEVTMRRLQKALYKEGRSARDIFDSLERRWKASLA